MVRFRLGLGRWLGEDEELKVSYSAVLYSDGIMAACVCKVQVYTLIQSDVVQQTPHFIALSEV